MYNTKFFHTVLLFLVAVQASFSAQLREDINSQLIILDDQELYVKKEITGAAGIVDLIDSSTRNKPGVCNFDENKLKQGRAFVFDQIAINYGTHATLSGQEGAIEYSTKAPAALQNAEFVVSQDGREVLRMSLRSLSNIQTGTAAAEEYTQLKTLRHLVDTREIKLQLHFPAGVAMAVSGTITNYIYVRLNGVQTTKKTNV